MDEFCENRELCNRFLHSIGLNHFDYNGKMSPNHYLMPTWCVFLSSLANLLYGWWRLDATVFSTVWNGYKEHDVILGQFLCSLSFYLHCLIILGVCSHQDPNQRVASTMAYSNGNHHPFPSLVGNLAALWILHLCEYLEMNHSDFFYENDFNFWSVDSNVLLPG